VDFLERLAERVNQIPNLPVYCEPGYLRTGESFVVYPLPGSRTATEYMDGTKERLLNYEFAMRSRVQGAIHSTLWMVQNVLDELDDLESRDGSFEFEGITITDTPFINGADDQGWYTFILTIQAQVTVYEEEKING
jgi:hypothetical protein